jgi:hypothetical protein
VTYRDLITAALKRIGVVGAGQTPSSEDASDALLRLNALLDSWATERLFVPSITRTTWTIVSGTGSYTVGSGGDVNIARPVFVQDIRFQDTNQSPTLEMPLEWLTDQAYANIALKTQQARYPTTVYYNPTFTGAGYATITLWPIPTLSTLQGVIYAPTTLVQVASLDTTVSLQPGYAWMIQENLAAMLAPEWGIQTPPELRESAITAKANIKRANTRLVEQATMEGNYFGRSGGIYNIYADQNQ